jgi:hypothetical protein
MVTVSPPVSPSVVARILMIQNPRVTAGTLLRMRSVVVLLAADTMILLKGRQSTEL